MYDLDGAGVQCEAWIWLMKQKYSLENIINISLLLLDLMPYGFEIGGAFQARDHGHRFY